MKKPAGFQPVYICLRCGSDLFGVGHRTVEIHVESRVICHDVESYGDMLDAFRHVYRHVYRLHTTVICTSVHKVYDVGDVIRLVICAFVAYHRSGCEVAEICHLCHIVDAILGHLEYSRGVGDITLNGDTRGCDSR